MTFVPPNFKTDPFFNLEDRWVKTDCNEVTHYFECGEGIPIIMLHGSGFAASASLNWWLNLPTLSNSFHTLAYDLIGYGETTLADDTAFGIKQWGEHTIRVMKALNLKKTWLIGSSLGGWIALQLAIDYPERFYGVISIGTGGAKREPVNSNLASSIKNAKSLNSLNSLSASKYTSELSPELIRQDLIKNIINEELVTDKLVDIRYKAAIKEQKRGLRSSLLAARDNDRHDFPLDKNALAQLKMPVLLIHGKQDKVVPLSHSLQLLETIPTAEAYIFTDCGHWPHLGKADEFNTLVTQFIAANHPETS